MSDETIIEFKETIRKRPVEDFYVSADFSGKIEPDYEIVGATCQGANLALTLTDQFIDGTKVIVNMADGTPAANGFLTVTIEAHNETTGRTERYQAVGRVAVSPNPPE
jgi:hypothetical protein